MIDTAKGLAKKVSKEVEEILRKAPVYPEWLTNVATNRLPACAPLCEEPRGKICYPTQEAKDWYIKNFLDKDN